jgi:hypothetical protein
MFDSSSGEVSEIREDQQYGGLRVTMRARLGKIVIPIQVDIGFGDAVTPEPKAGPFPVLLDFPPPILRMYPRERPRLDSCFLVTRSVSTSASTSKPYEFCPPRYAAWIQPVMHLLAAVLLRYQFAPISGWRSWVPGRFRPRGHRAPLARSPRGNREDQKGRDARPLAAGAEGRGLRYHPGSAPARNPSRTPAEGDGSRHGFDQRLPSPSPQLRFGHGLAPLAVDPEETLAKNHLPGADCLASESHSRSISCCQFSRTPKRSGASDTQHAPSVRVLSVAWSRQRRNTASRMRRITSRSTYASATSRSSLGSRCRWPEEIRRRLRCTGWFSLGCHAP